MADRLVVASNLTKSFGRTRALKSVSFALDRGIHSLIGPNGAGKTTLLRILAGLLRPNRGEVRVLGLDPTHEGERVSLMRRVGIVHENPSFPLWATGRSLLERAAKMKGVSDVVGEVKRVAELTGCSEYIGRKTGEYSAGMKQRLEIALALIGDPELVLMDEPTSNLDPIGRSRVLRLISRLHRSSGVNFIISTHALSGLEPIITEILFLREGRLILSGRFDELKESLGRWVLLVSESARQELEVGFSARLAVSRPGRYGVISSEIVELLSWLCARAERGEVPAGVELRELSLDELFEVVVKGG